MASKCTFDPKTYKGMPIGMFHCPDCGEMVLAGVEHPDYDNVDYGPPPHGPEDNEEL